MILGIIYIAQKALENDKSRLERRRYFVGLIALIALCFAYFYPLFVGGVMTYADWYARMWFPNWI